MKCLHYPEIIAHLDGLYTYQAEIAAQQSEQEAERRNEMALTGADQPLTREEEQDLAQCERDYGLS